MAENKLESIVVKGVEYDIGGVPRDLPISQENITDVDDSIDFEDSNGNIVAKITSNGVKVKDITDLYGKPIGGQSEYRIDQDYVYEPVYRSSNFNDWSDYDYDSRGVWTKGSDGISPTAIGGYVNDYLCGAIYLPNIYRSHYKICCFDVILYSDNILNIHFIRDIKTSSTPNESVYKIDCVNKKLIITKLNNRQVTDVVLKEQSIPFDIIDGDKYSVNIVKKDLYFSMEIVNKYGESIKIEHNGDWLAGTQLQSYGFSLGAGNLNLKITNFRVYLPCDVNAVICGDSITDGYGMIPNEDYRWSINLASAIGNSIVSGASSGTLGDVLNPNYWNNEILKVRPKYFIMMMGTNNSGGNADATRNLKSQYENVVEACKKSGIIPIILHIPMMTERTENDIIINEEIIDSLDVDTAKTDVATAIGNTPSNGCNTTLFIDGCHPNKNGSIAIINRFKLDLPYLFNHKIKV